jgi:hypothetical protein
MVGGFMFNNIHKTTKPGFATQPNALLVATVEGRNPGRALDVGVGQGRNAKSLPTITPAQLMASFNLASALERARTTTNRSTSVRSRQHRVDGRRLDNFQTLCNLAI